MRIFFFFFFEHRKKGICAAFKVDAAGPENLIPFFYGLIYEFYGYKRLMIIRLSELSSTLNFVLSKLAL